MDIEKMGLHKSVARVKNILYMDTDITIFTAEVNNIESRCINYNQMTGIVKIGDFVILNTTAVELGLGTGGYHFVMAVPEAEIDEVVLSGRDIKLNYLPMQICCKNAEAEESEYHDLFEKFTSLEDMPVIIGSLHSMLAPTVLYLNHINEKARICYIMTDGAALPIWISNSVRELKRRGIISTTITCGNAIGGDFECVNIYTGMIAAREIAKADVAIVCMGPGIVGTATKYGHKGLEQGQIIDAVNTLGGTPVAIPRISFSDKRERHWGISHHSLTTLTEICKTAANIAIPENIAPEKKNILKQQIDASELSIKHKIYYVNVMDTDCIFDGNDDLINTMGRGYREDKEYFLTCAAAAKLVQKLV